MGKVILYALFFLAIALISYFGLGPILLADGTSSKSTLTLVIVLGIYLVVIITFLAIRRSINKADTKEK